MKLKESNVIKLQLRAANEAVIALYLAVNEDENEISQEQEDRLSTQLVEVAEKLAAFYNNLARLNDQELLDLKNE